MKIFSLVIYNLKNGNFWSPRSSNKEEEIIEASNNLNKVLGDDYFHNSEEVIPKDKNHSKPHSNDKR